MRDAPLVSVGLPTYNRPEGLRRTLECLTRQTHKNIEIIVSDNASPGTTTTEVVQSFARNDPRIKYIRQAENIGGAQNFIYVFGATTGKYFAWFADDDTCEDTFLEALVAQMETSPDIAVAMSDVRFVDELRSSEALMHLASIRWESARDDWEATRRLFFAYPTSHIFICIYGLYRTEVLRRCRQSFLSRWKDITFASEVPFLAQLAVRGKIVSVPEVLKTYHTHKDSMYVREQARINRFDKFVRDTEVRLELTSIALRSSLPLSERLLLGAQPWPLLGNASRILSSIRR